MPNITLSIPEELLKNGRQYARARGTSLNGLVRELLSATIATPSDSADSIISRLRHSSGDSKGIRFSREELHRR